MNLFTELKRRNVFRVAIGYIVSMWLLAQAADFVLDIIGAPSWVIQTILLLMALGLPVIVFFSWAYEVTPEGIKRESEVDRNQSITHVTGKKLDRAIIVMLAIALVYFIWESRFAIDGEPSGPGAAAPDVAEEVVAASPEDSSPQQPERLSIAVLPFENRSNREEDQFFTDGIHDDLLTTIAKIGSMKVISRTSVMEYRGTTKKIPEIAGELGVAHILEGGIQRSGNQVRVNVQLIDAQTDEHLWAEIFDRELTAENLFAIQSEVSNKIAEALQARLTPAEQRRIDSMPTENLEAYEAYLRGKQLLATRRVADLQQATQEFQKAVELDPEFALAWVAVADSRYLLNNYTRAPASASLQIREQAVEKALSLDPELGEAWISQAQIYVDLEQFDEAEAAFKKGLELSPNYAQGYHWYGTSMADDELRTRERLQLAYRARELDPRSMIIGANLAAALFDLGLNERGEAEARRLIDLYPEFPNSYHMLVDYYMYRSGEYAKALEMAQKLTEMDPNSIDGYFHQGEIFVEIGDYDSARAMQEKLAELNPDHYMAGSLEYMIALYRGNHAAFREAANWLLSRAQDHRFLLHMVGDGHLMIGDLRRARELSLQGHPGYLDPAEWEGLIRNAPGDACNVAWLLLNTGDEDLGSRLAEQALEFHEVELPAVKEDPDQHNAVACYLAQGDLDKALDVMQTRLDHGHISFWAPWMRSPIYDPLRQEPRFIAMQEKHERLIDVQREAVEKMLRASGPRASF